MRYLISTLDRGARTFNSRIRLRKLVVILPARRRCAGRPVRPRLFNDLAWHAKGAARQIAGTIARGAGDARSPSPARCRASESDRVHAWLRSQSSTRPPPTTSWSYGS